jgi:hypothetical protein
LGTCKDTDRNGTAGCDLSGELIARDGILLPFGLVGTLVIADGYKRPRGREPLELSDEADRVHADLWGPEV